MQRSRPVLGLALLLIAAGCADRDTPEQPVSPSADPANPFMAESELPYGMPPFDLIKDEHYVPAFERGMAEESAEIEAIAANPEAAGFDNTIVAMEHSGQLLTRALRVFRNLTGAHTNETLQ